jgi:hypothetical protein
MVSALGLPHVPPGGTSGAGRHGVQGRAARAAAGVGRRGARLLHRRGSGVRVQGRRLRRRISRRGQVSGLRAAGCAERGVRGHGRRPQLGRLLRLPLGRQRRGQRPAREDVRQGLLGLPRRDLRRRRLRPHRPARPGRRRGRRRLPLRQPLLRAAGARRLPRPRAGDTGLRRPAVRPGPAPARRAGRRGQRLGRPRRTCWNSAASASWSTPRS